MAKELIIPESLKELAAMSVGFFEDATYGIVPARPATISLVDNQFSLVKDGERIALSNPHGEQLVSSPHELFFVVAMPKIPRNRIYWGKEEDGTPKKYDPLNPQGPVCQSLDSVTPEEGVPEKQSDTCAACPQAVWGSDHSAKTGKEIPACRSYRGMAIKIIGIEGPWYFGIPPASDKEWGPLVDKIKEVENKERARHGYATFTLSTCIIRATFIGTGIIGFEPKGYLYSPETEKVIEMRRNPDRLMTMLWGPRGKAREEQWKNRNAPPPVSNPPPIIPIPVPPVANSNFPKQVVETKPSSAETIRQRVTRNIRPPVKEGPVTRLPEYEKPVEVPKPKTFDKNMKETLPTPKTPEQPSKTSNEIDDIMNDMGISTFNE